MTTRERHPARGAVLLALAVWLGISTALQFRVDHSSVSNTVWLVTVIPALIIATLLTAGYGFFDLCGRTKSRDEEQL